MLQNLDYMILLDADISFCMVCKLWYISIRCIFKNLALKLRIYNFRDVCVCNCPPHLPSPSPQSFPSYPSIILSFPLFMYLSECLPFCLSGTFSSLFPVDHLLPFLFLYSIHCLSFLRELYIYCF